MDVNTIFLYGELDETIMMKQPKGFEIGGKEEYVWKLKRSLYGLNGSFEVPHPHRDVNLMRVEPNKEIKECGFNTSPNSCEELNFWVAYRRWLLVTGFRN